MKILIVEYRDIHHPEAGGAELVLFEVFSRLVQQNYKVDYLCSRYEGSKSNEEINGINVIRRGNQFVFNFIVPKVYLKELKHNNYDLILEGIDKLPFFLPLFEKKVPILSIVPHLFGTAIFKEASFLIGSYVYLYEQFIPSVYKDSFFSVPSKSTKEDLVKRGLNQERIQVIYNGMNHSLHVAPIKKSYNAEPTIIYVGRIKKYKGIDIGLKAVSLIRKKYPNIKYLITGAGDYLDELKRITTELRLQENVSFLGFVTDEEKVKLLQKADVLIYPSAKEGWGLSIIEANACGTPAIASNSPGLCESVRNGETGFLVRHGDADALAEKIDILLSDKDVYDKMREKAIQWSREFNWERAARETFSYIEEIVDKKCNNIYEKFAE